MAETKLGQDAITFPSGTTAQRPSSPVGGMARYNEDNDNIEYYNGDEDIWVSLAEPPLGTSANPAISAQQILDAGDSTGDGVYFMKPSGFSGVAFPVFCDMTNFGGGWMIVSKWFQDAPYTIDELYNANPRNTNLLLSPDHLTTKSSHARLSRDQMNALWGESNAIARIDFTDSSGSTSSPLGTYFQKKLTNVVGFDFWAAHYNSRAWSDDITAGSTYIQDPGSTYKVMRLETSGTGVFTDSRFTDFDQPSVRNGPGWWDFYTVNAPNFGNIDGTRHMGFFGDIYEGNQWVLTNNPSDSRFTDSDNREGRRTIVYLK